MKFGKDGEFLDLEGDLCDNCIHMHVCYRIKDLIGKGCENIENMKIVVSECEWYISYKSEDDNEIKH